MPASHPEGLTSFLGELKTATGRNVNWWTGGLTWFANTAHVADIQPFIDNLELSAYWDSAPFNTSDAGSWDSYDTLGYKTRNPHVMNPNDTAILVDDYGYRPDQIVAGVGLSSFSYMQVPEAILPLCAYQGFLGTGPPECANISKYPMVTAADSLSHASIGTNGVVGRCWDQIQQDVATGGAVQGVSDAYRPGYGPLPSHWIFYPNRTAAAAEAAGGGEVLGELTFWNDQQHLDLAVREVGRVGIAGVFTWTATSDAADWRVHKRLRAQLDAL